MLTPHPARLRSHSNPPRPRATKTEPKPEQTNVQLASPSPDPSRAVSSSFMNSVESLKPKGKQPFIPPSPARSEASRKFFRIKRPSSSSSALRPTYEHELPHSRSGYHVPPRPPRNPARSIRPSSSSGLGESEKPPLISGTLSKQLVSVPLEGKDPTTFTLPPTSDIALQRRKSKRKDAVFRSNEASNGMQFSTADRTILEELKEKIKIRDAQFLLRNGRKHHPHSAKEVPYPTNYDRQVVDNDIWETRWMQQVCGSITWHVFKEPPARVLDIGCGVGTWILDSARSWRDTHFVGVDIVPLHPDLLQVGSSQLASRITWIQANILEPLPFQDEEFDYVHIKRIARGVPEDKWDALFEEILRVMKPGAAFEIIEENLYFPGSIHQSQSPPPSPDRTNAPTSPLDRPRAPTPLSSPYIRAQASFISDAEAGALHVRASMNQRSFTEPIQLHSPQRIPKQDASMTEATQTRSRESLLRRKLTKLPPPVNPRDHSVLEYIYNEMHATRFINLEPLPLLANWISFYFKDVRTHPPLIASFPPLPAPRDPVSSTGGQSRSTSGDRGWSPDSRKHPAVPLDIIGPGSPIYSIPSDSSTTASPGSPTPSVSLDRLLQGSNPFVTLDGSRFNAFSPSSRASFPSPSQASPSVFRQPLGHFSLPPPLLSPPCSPGVDSHPSPAFPSSAMANVMRPSRLPNTQLDFDVGSLNVHLSLRVHEVIGCAEAMWDFVLGYKRMHAPRRYPPYNRGSAAGQRSSNSRTLPQPAELPIHSALLSMGRSDFDRLLAWFRFDMQDCMGLRSAMEDRLSWTITSVSRGPQRQEFDKLCLEHARYLLDPYNYYPLPQDGLQPEVVNSPMSSSWLLLGDDETEDGSHPGHSADSHSDVQSKTDSSGSHSHSGHSHALPEIPPPSPTSRLSRTLRVLVAWKP